MWPDGMGYLDAAWKWKGLTGLGGWARWPCRLGLTGATRRRLGIAGTI